MYFPTWMTCCMLTSGLSPPTSMIPSKSLNALLRDHPVAEGLIKVNPLQNVEIANYSQTGEPCLSTHICSFPYFSCSKCQFIENFYFVFS